MRRASVVPPRARRFPHPEGEVFAARIRPLLKKLAAARRGLSTTERPLAGAVTLDLTHDDGAHGPAHAAASSRSRAGVKLNFLTGYSGYVHEWLVDGRLDIAILHDARRFTTYCRRPAGSHELFLVSDPGLARQPVWQRKASVPVRQLAALPLALPSRSPAFDVRSTTPSQS